MLFNEFPNLSEEEEKDNLLAEYEAELEGDGFQDHDIPEDESVSDTICPHCGGDHESCVDDSYMDRVREGEGIPQEIWDEMEIHDPNENEPWYPEYLKDMEEGAKREKVNGVGLPEYGDGDFYPHNYIDEIDELNYANHRRLEGNHAWNQHPDGCYFCGGDHHSDCCGERR